MIVGRAFQFMAEATKIVGVAVADIIIRHLRGFAVK